VRPLTALRYLSRQDVAAVLPGTVEQIDLVQETYLAMAAGRVEQPPKPGIHPRPDAFIHAMPVYLADQDVAALKWVSGYPENRDRGLPYISGLVIVNDPATGVPLAIMDAVENTAARTAAASGVCIRRWAPPGWGRAAILGCGEQGRYHAKMLRVLNPDARIAAWDPDASRVAAMPGPVEAAGDPHAAVAGADVVITCAPIVEDARPTLTSAGSDAPRLLLPIDFDASIGAALVRAADLLVVDDVAQFEYYRSQGHFRDWPQPDASAGEALRDGRGATSVVCCNLGVGALDAAFASHVLRAAERDEAYTTLLR
jgi:ornithine cyclodeaminase/alanine dehydrogenase